MTGQIGALGSGVGVDMQNTAQSGLGALQAGYGGASAGLNGLGAASAGSLQGLSNNFLSQNPADVANYVSGISGPLKQSLSQAAQYQANNALNTVGSNFANQGALGSGAAAQAMGEAIANPFAQAAASLQGSQLGAASSAMSNLINSQGGVTQSLLGGTSQLGSSLLGAQSGLGSSLLSGTSGLNSSLLGSLGNVGSSTIGSTGSALGNALDASASIFGQGLNNASNFTESTSGLVAPQTFTNPTWAANVAQQQSLLNGGVAGAQSGKNNASNIGSAALAAGK
jgi:hypothetical protein